MRGSDGPVHEPEVEVFDAEVGEGFFKCLGD